MDKSKNQGGVEVATKPDTSPDTHVEESPDSFGDFNAEAIYAAIEEGKVDPSPEGKPEAGDEGKDGSKETEQKADAETKPEQKAEGGEGGGDADDLFSTPELDAELASNPKLKKRWDEQQAGLRKIYDREKELLPKIERMASYVDGLAKPETAGSTLKEVLELTAANTRMSVADLLKAAGISAQTPAQNASTAAAQTGAQSNGQKTEVFAAHRDKFLNDDEYEFANEIGGLILEQFRTELGPLTDMIRSMQSGQAAAGTQTKFAQAVKAELPKVSGYFGSNYDGFSVTEQMLSEALETFPHLADKPIEAVKKHFTDDLIKHTRAKAAKPVERKAPEGLSSDDSRGSRGLDPDEEITAETVYAALNGR